MKIMNKILIRAPKIMRKMLQTQFGFANRLALIALTVLKEVGAEVKVSVESPVIFLLYMVFNFLKYIVLYSNST